MFFGALHPREVLAGSALDESGRALGVDDVGTCTGQVIVYLQQSKTDQRGWGQRIILNRPNMQLCPVNILGRYLQGRPLVGGYLFIHEDQSPLTIYQFRAMVMWALEDMGFVSSDYGLHLFRMAPPLQLWIWVSLLR